MPCMNDWPQIIINIVAAQYPLNLSSILLERIAFFYTCCLRSYNSFRSLIDILIVCLPTKLYLEKNNYFFSLGMSSTYRTQLFLSLTQVSGFGGRRP
ncbi:hypothetical protein NC651_001575 [Populus alba x Populus x berolinensis]|nr:hypothetical protein NC651_001575 [Populus alba x Populus x berolinensis]